MYRQSEITWLDWQNNLHLIFENCDTNSPTWDPYCPILHDGGHLQLHLLHNRQTVKLWCGDGWSSLNPTNWRQTQITYLFQRVKLPRHHWILWKPSNSKTLITWVPAVFRSRLLVPALQLSFQFVYSSQLVTSSCQGHFYLSLLSLIGYTLFALSTPLSTPLSTSYYLLVYLHRFIVT